MKFLEKEKGNPYAEIQQTADIKYAPIGVSPEGLYQTHQWFRCKDFFNELVCARRHGTKQFSQYGFVYDAKKQPGTEDTQYLVRTVNYKKVQQGIQKYLNPLEAQAGLELTTSKLIQENVLHITADPAWYSEIYMVSIHTLLLRLFSTGNMLRRSLETLLAGIDPESTDGKLLENIKKVSGNFSTGITNMVLSYNNVKRTNEEFRTCIADLKNSELHNYGGVLSLLQAGNSAVDYNYIREITDKLHPNLKEIL